MISTFVALLLASAPDATTPRFGAKLGGPTNPVHIICDHMHVDNKQHKAICVGNVKARRQDVDLTCDKMTSFFAGTSESVTHLQCDGHVVVIEPDRRGTGEHADFDNVNGILVFTGNPKAYQGQSEFEGDKVTFFVGTDQIEVEHARGLLDSAETKSAVGKDKKKADGGVATKKKP